MAKTPPLEIEINLTPSGVLSNVVLDGRDISNYVRGIYIEAGVGEFTEVSIDYGNVNVSGKIRTEKLHEATTPVDITGLGDENRRYGLVDGSAQRTWTTADITPELFAEASAKSAASEMTAYQVARETVSADRIVAEKGVVVSLPALRGCVDPLLDTYGNTLRPAVRTLVDAFEDLSRAIVNATEALHENRPAHEQVTNARKALGCEVMSK